ncbi:MAG: carbohydrate-binding domain-containing protein [Prevotella sp.]|nr:carbohydrate-binding domain-containing protein [Prevotella sp.]
MQKDSVKVAVNGACVSIESLYKTHKLTLRLSGRSDDGQLVLKTAGKAKVTLDGLTLTSQEGAPLWLKNKKKVEVKAVKGTVNTLTVTACTDTASHKGAVIWAKDKLLLSGKGVLNLVATGDGCRGLKTQKDITIEELTLNVTTSGNNLGEKPFGFGGFPGFGNDSTGFGGKHKYYASAKGIASKGKITIDSGHVTVRTATAGAEGIEGKQGIVFNGGTVDVLSPDDAINANAAIEFNGAHVTAHSLGNDAVDANPAGGFFPPFGGGNEQKIEPVIIIRGGTVYAWSQVGPPEEGLDSDMAPLAIEGGTVFYVGGSIGDAPSVPTNEIAKQPTVLLSNLNIIKGEPVNILDADGHPIHSVSIHFSFRGSATLVSCPAFKTGSTYKIENGNDEKTFTLSEPFTVVRM